MGSVRATRGAEVPAGPATPGMTRKLLEVDRQLSLAQVQCAPQATSAWHHHGEHTACVYVVRGQLRIEWGPGGCESVDLAAGDFYVVSPNTIHREGNPASDEQEIVAFYLGSGPSVVNVDGPESER